MAKKDRLEKFGNILSKIPIVNKVEPEQIVRIIKALWVEPLIVVLSIALGISTVQFYNEPSELLKDILVTMVWLLLFFVAVYIGKSITIHYFKEQTARYKLHLADKQENIEMVKNIVQHQEGLRTEWFKGHQDYLLFNLSIQKDSLKEINNDNALEDTVKNHLINKILNRTEELEIKYKSLLDGINNDYEAFIIKHTLAPPKTTLNAKKYIADLMSQLDGLSSDSADEHP